MKLHRRNRGGVTIADALVIVAMLALVATIAAPTWGDAKHRADIAGVKDDFLELARALEAYKVDQGNYVRMIPPGPCLNVSPIVYTPTFERLTTPVSYIGGPPPFFDRYEAEIVVTSDGLNNRYVMEDAMRGPYFYTARHATSSAQWGTGGPNPTWYLLESAGPDKMRYSLTTALDSRAEGSTEGLSLFSSIIYDPTNGLVSIGSIWRAGGTISGAGSDLGRMVQENGSAGVGRSASYY